MASLADTVAALAQRRRWPQASPGTGGRLRRVAAFGPNPGDLEMLVHTPETLAPGSPLVVVLHGCTQSAEGYAEGAGWLTLADRHGFAVLCPEQARGNNPNLCFNWFEPADTTRGMGEVASIKSMIDHAVAEYALDPGRVLVTGLSAGGAMANAMLATYPETFSAGAIVAGLPYGVAANMHQALNAMRRDEHRPVGFWGDVVRAASDHRGPWPRVAVWQGGSDAMVRPGAADDLVRQWLELHQAQDVAIDTAGIVSGHRHLMWRSPDGEPVVELHTFADMGHGAPVSCSGPDACGAAGPYLLDVGVSSSLEIARFWGLVPISKAPAGVKRTPVDPTDGKRRRAPAAPPDRALVNVEAIISTALRSAGLLR